MFIFVFFHNDLMLINNEILMEQYWTDMSRRSEVVGWQTDDLKATSMWLSRCGGATDACEREGV